MLQPSIEGLSVVKRFLDDRAQATLVEAIDQDVWNTTLKRRVQHFGHVYEYARRAVSSSARAEPLPSWALALLHELRSAGVTSEAFDQVIVNEYMPGQGIATHVDRADCFGPEVLSVSLLGACVMRFLDSRSAETRGLLLEPGDVLVLKDSARYQWAHGIASRKHDRWNGTVIRRQRRISITYRRVLA